jgi:hypothetical protein
MGKEARVMAERLKRYRVFVRYNNDEFFDAWECDATSILALIMVGEIGRHIGDQPYDELTVTEIRSPFPSRVMP